MTDEHNNPHRHRANLKQVIRFDLDDDFDSYEPVAAKQAPASREEPLADDPLCFMSLGSGSSGNCAYVGTREAGILVDAGVDADFVFEQLERNGIKGSQVKGIILTHDHNDHIKCCYKILRNHKHIRLLCTPRTLNGLLRRHNVSTRIKDYQTPCYIEIPFKLAGLDITAFATSHDGTDNVGYSISAGGKTFVVATDMGIITERAEHYMAQANYLMIESDYDEQMLTTGRYAEYLKSRIRSAVGHLSNDDAAQFVGSHYHEGLKYVFLCHLSHDNNTPQIAWDTVAHALQARNVTVGDASNNLTQRDRDVQLYVLPRYEASPWFVLD